MTDMKSLEARIKRLEDMEAIRNLKHRYFRFVDCKQWDELAACFAEDAVADYSDGRFHLQGANEIMSFLRTSLERVTFVTAHFGHHPEIEVTGDATATGIWQLYSPMIDTKSGTASLLAAFYHDTYIKIDGEWKIQATGTTTLFQESWRTTDIESFKLTVPAGFDA